jgi:hypothetical protein
MQDICDSIYLNVADNLQYFPEPIYCTML